MGSREDFNKQLIDEWRIRFGRVQVSRAQYYNIFFNQQLSVKLCVGLIQCTGLFIASQQKQENNTGRGQNIF